jgi:hydrogenase maturation protein HypF
MLGVMLPSTALHHLLLGELAGPVVATSGNLSEEPICSDESDAVSRLGGLADGFLVHDRPIARPVDDSVVRVILGREQLIRRARGYAPLPVRMPNSVDGLLAVGGHLKNAVALGVGHDLFVSQHIGDLDTVAATACFEATVDDLQDLFQVRAHRVVCDLHPDYRSSRFAHASGLPVVAIQHHVAHIAACMAENELAPPVLGLSWDGTGYGTDGTTWGGEVIRFDEDGTYERCGHLRRFRLPGGEVAVREPRRSAVGMLHEAFGPDWKTLEDLAPVRAFTPAERNLLDAAMNRGLNAPRTSSLGRMFDGVAALLGLGQVSAFEGQAAMALEFAARDSDEATGYPVELAGMELDWRPMLRAVVEDLRAGLAPIHIAARFHRTLVSVAQSYARTQHADRIVLSGGCFQNEHLTALVAGAFARDGIRVYTHQRIPPNDGGLCVGQAALASSLLFATLQGTVPRTG